VVEPYRGYSEPEVFVDIPPGSSTASIGNRLVDAGVVRDARTFQVGLWISGRSRSLRAGEYRFDAPLHALDVIDKIARGDVYRRRLTFREGLTIPEMAQVFEERGFGNAADFRKAAENAALILDLDPGATDLEGYLFPETYALPRGTTAAAVVAQMVDAFKNALTAEIRSNATTAGLSVRQLVTLASLVEKETGTASERPLVAAVYANRLKIGMAMQADPTVIYALQKAGTYTGNLRRDDLQFDSPYNTYRYPGLPPGPIAAPGKASLEAAAKPADVDYLYFVSKNDGSHVFASSLEEHNRNVQTWQRDYFRQRRQNAR
ncbi:MAG TPA: endolytic transglycosylase MltG, partial [Vicinamibacterales bacterium]